MVAEITLMEEQGFLWEVVYCFRVWQANNIEACLKPTEAHLTSHSSDFSSL